ncbi:MAG: hypothetical protein FJ026_04255 [Chloroflexi bacterium]|nr:hypothetical protein [Chloroflexota bacterium]
MPSKKTAITAAHTDRALARTLLFVCGLDDMADMLVQRCAFVKDSRPVRTPPLHRDLAAKQVPVAAQWDVETLQPTGL